MATLHIAPERGSVAALGPVEEACMRAQMHGPHRRTRARTHARMHACTHARMHAHTHACTRTHSHARARARTHARTHARTSVDEFVSPEGVHTRARTWKHTHARTHSSADAPPCARARTHHFHLLLPCRKVFESAQNPLYTDGLVMSEGKSDL